MTYLKINKSKKLLATKENGTMNKYSMSPFLMKVSQLHKILIRRMGIYGGSTEKPVIWCRVAKRFIQPL
jgi:hypothetical protein